MTKEEFAQELIRVFPEKKKAFVAHNKDYGELLGHVFFGDEINIPLVELLRDNNDSETIDKYCKFVEKMWSCGTEAVINIVDVTILERLSDENKVWINFGNYISDEFKTYINESVLPENSMMFSVPRL